jgi:putative membrane protein
MRTLLLATGCVAALALAGCHKTGSNAQTDNPKPSDSAPVNTAQDVAATGVGMASAVTHGTTVAAYVPAAAMADMYEIEAGKIALQRSKSPQVKHLAQMIIDDHTAMSNKMKAALPQAAPGVTPPTGLDDRRTGMINNLKAAGDSDFDLAYLHQQLAAHTEAVTLHSEYAKAGDNPALKQLASDAVPMIQKHLSEIKTAGGAKLQAMSPG